MRPWKSCAIPKSGRGTAGIRTRVFSPQVLPPTAVITGHAPTCTGMRATPSAGRPRAAPCAAAVPASGRQFIDPRTQRAGPWKTRTRLGMERPNPGNRTPPRLGRQVTRKARWISRPSLQSERTTPAHTCSKLSSSANDRQARPWAVGGGNHSHTPDLKAQASAVSARWGEVVSVTVIQGLV